MRMYTHGPQNNFPTWNDDTETANNILKKFQDVFTELVLRNNRNFTPYRLIIYEIGLGVRKWEPIYHLKTILDPPTKKYFQETKQ